MCVLIFILKHAISRTHSSAAAAAANSHFHKHTDRQIDIAIGTHRCCVCPSLIVFLLLFLSRVKELWLLLLLLRLKHFTALAHISPVCLCVRVCHCCWALGGNRTGENDYQRERESFSLSIYTAEARQIAHCRRSSSSRFTDEAQFCALAGSLFYFSVHQMNARKGRERELFACPIALAI